MDKEEVNTLDHLEDDNKNTETETIVEESDQLEESNQISNEEDSNQPDEKNNYDKIDMDILDSLDDDQFKEYFETGKLPEKVKTKKSIDKTEENKIPSEQQSTVVNSKKENTSTSNKSNVEKETSTQNDIDYKSIYDKVFNGFKANGKEIKPRTVDDVISLMQQGANYTKKMQLMAPMRKTIESLNKANIKEEDLNFLIDVHNGDKEAIKKLLEKHKVDPVELDMDNTNYVPKNNIISDEDVEYSNTIDDIQSSIPKINEIINKQWDKQSKQLLLKDPKLMKALHEEIELGRFDKIQTQLEEEKIFGRYKNIPDIAIYRDILLKKLAEEQNKTPTVTVNTKSSNTPKKEIPDKKGAAPNKSKVSSQGSSTITAKDIFSMSEEEFNKLNLNDLI